MLEETGQRREFWIVGPEYSDSEKEFRVFWNDCKKLDLPFDRPGTYNNPEAGDMSVSLWNGRFKVHAKSAKYPSTLVGEGLSGVIMAEAAKMKRSVWVKYIRPTLADFGGWSLHNSTPEGKNWFYDLWRRGQDPADKAWASWRKPSWENPYVFPLGKDDPEIKDMRLDMSAELFNQEIAALFTDYVGKVFKDWEEETHVTDILYRADLPLYGACDYGWTNPFVWLAIQVDVWGNVYVLDEYRVTNRDITDIGKDLANSDVGRRTVKFYPDPAEPGDTAILSKMLRAESVKDTGGEKKGRIEKIRQALKVGPDHAPAHEQKPKLFIDRKCKGLIYEMGEYRYPDQKSELRAAPEEPLDKDDHGPEALGRFYRGYFGKTLEKQHAKQSKAFV